AGDRVAEGDTSDPFLVAGYDERILHLAANARDLALALEVDPDGSDRWERWTAIEPGSYAHVILPADLRAEWLRLRVDRGEGIVTAYFHMNSRRPESPGASPRFDGLADADDARSYAGGLIRPAEHDRSLQFLATTVADDGTAEAPRYIEVRLDDDATDLAFIDPVEDRSDEVRRVAAVGQPFEVD